MYFAAQAGKTVQLTFGYTRLQELDYF
jgi:hypothetical protein